MAQDTKIQWADHTWNPWRGCAKISEGCANCYAAAMSVRNPKVLGTWGVDGERPLGNAAYWRQPYAWDRQATDAGERRRVFCGSLMDFWEDRPDLVDPRYRALDAAYDCTKLDWLFLSKRPQNALPLLRRHYPAFWGAMRRQSVHNWWFGCTVESYRRAVERIPVLCEIPARVRFLSCEPLLEPLDLSPWLEKGGIHWVIVGGESNQGGEKARPFDLEWAEEIVEQCRQHGVACFVKQMGSRPVAAGLGLKLKDRHGGDWDEWPDWMRVRQVPKAT